MRKLTLFTILAGTAIFPGCDCGKSSGSSSSSSSTPAPSTAVKIGPAGGSIVRGEAKLEIPKGALAAEQDVDFVEAPAVLTTSYQRAGKGYLLTAGQATFSAPLTVTLPIDRSLLPEGCKPEQIGAVIANRGLGEVLEGAKVDLDARTVTVTIDRTAVLASGDAAGSGAGPILQASLSPLFDTLEASSTVVWRAAKGLERSAEMLEKGKAIWTLVKRAYSKIEAPDTGQMTFTFRSMNPRWGGVTSSAHTIDINSDTFLNYAPDVQGSVFMHEYFHALQKCIFLQNIRDLKVPLPGDYSVRGKTSWLDEATATWMQEHLSGQGAGGNVLRLESDFCYLPLNTFHDSSANKNSHQYAAYVFFAWLDTLYSGQSLVMRTHREFLSGAWTRNGLEFDAPQGRGTFNPLDILDRYVRETPDVNGRKRTLREVYADFVLHYGWFKDFGALANGGAKTALGEAKDLVVPAAYTTAWTLPDSTGGTREMKKSEKVAGEGFHIIRAYHLTAAFDKAHGEKGDLEVSLKSARGVDPKDSMVVVFPYRKGPEAPVVGSAGSPAVLKDWQQDIGAIVWVVDLSITGQFDLEVSAEVKPSGAPAAASSMDFTLTASRWPETWMGASTIVDFKLEFAEPPGLAQMSTDEQMKAMEQRAKWQEELEKELAGGKKWLHLTIAGAGRVQHFYMHADPRSPASEVLGGELFLPRATGEFEYTATLKLHGKTMTCRRKMTVQLPGDVNEVKKDIARGRGEVAELKKAKADPGTIAARLLTLGDDLEYIHEDTEAEAVWSEALDLAPPADQPAVKRRFANHALLEGDPASYKKWIESSGEPPNYVDWAKRQLRFLDDPPGARALLKKWPSYDPANDDMFIPSPGDGDSIAE